MTGNLVRAAVVQGAEPGPPVVLEGDVADQRAATPIEPGTQELTVEVIVRFAID
jgi:uncharacterized protein YggE